MLFLIMENCTYEDVLDCSCHSDTEPSHCCYCFKQHWSFDGGVFTHVHSTFCSFLHLRTRFFISCIMASSGTWTAHLWHPQEQRPSSSSCKRLRTGWLPLQVGIHSVNPTETRWGLIFLRPPQRAVGRICYQVTVSICYKWSSLSTVYNVYIQGSILICLLSFLSFCRILPVSNTKP